MFPFQQNNSTRINQGANGVGIGIYNSNNSLGYQPNFNSQMNPMYQVPNETYSTNGSCYGAGYLKNNTCQNQVPSSQIGSLQKFIPLLEKQFSSLIENFIPSVANNCAESINKNLDTLLNKNGEEIERNKKEVKLLAASIKALVSSDKQTRKELSTQQAHIFNLLKEMHNRCEEKQHYFEQRLNDEYEKRNNFLNDNFQNIASQLDVMRERFNETPEKINFLQKVGEQNSILTDLKKNITKIYYKVKKERQHLVGKNTESSSPNTNDNENSNVNDDETEMNENTLNKMDDNKVHISQKIQYLKEKLKKDYDYFGNLLNKYYNIKNQKASILKSKEEENKNYLQKTQTNQCNNKNTITQ